MNQRTNEDPGPLARGLWVSRGTGEPADGQAGEGLGAG